MEPRLKYEKALLRYYNQITGSNLLTVDEMPSSAIEVMKFLEYEDLVKPFIALDLMKGLGRNVIKRKYSCRVTLVRTIGEKMKVYKKRLKE